MHAATFKARPAPRRDGNSALMFLTSSFRGFRTLLIGDYIGRTENKMETTIDLGFRAAVKELQLRYVIPTFWRVEWKIKWKIAWKLEV